MPRFDRERPPYEDVGYGTEEPLYADWPAVSPDLPEPTPWWEIGPERPGPLTAPSGVAPSPSGFHPGAPADRRPPGYTGLSPAMEGAVAAYHPSPQGPSVVTLRQAKQEKAREKRLADRRRQEAVKWQREQVEKERKLEKERIKAMEKLREKEFALKKLAILKPAWGI